MHIRPAWRLGLLARAASAATDTASRTPGTAMAAFVPIAAADFVQRLDPGWNLGNTLDAVPDEGSWNNRPVVPATLAVVKEAGFRSVRIPVTYADHYVGGAPDWAIDAAWLQRVVDVVDMALAEGFYVVTNVHHDSWKWADVTKNDVAGVYEKFYATWLQIGRALAHMPSTVAFEPINEAPAETAADGEHINELNRLFLQALAATGGNNTQRVVTLVGGNEDARKTADWFVRPPANTTNPWALQFHYYSPYNYIFSAWGKTIWGSDEEKKALVADLQLLRDKFSDVPLVLGEFSASPINCERGARWRYVDFLVRTARQMNIAVMMWDNGLDNLERGAARWRDPTSIGIITGTAVNSLPGGTTDDKAATQASSAFIYQRAGAPTKAQTLPFILNGNTIVSVEADGQPLDRSDYRVNGSDITFTKALLSRYFTPNATAGCRGTFTVAFSQGISLPVALVLWDTPTLETAASEATAAAKDLKIAVQYKGLATVAAVTMVAIHDNGTTAPISPLFDDWTQYLGPLQQGRATFEKQWNFDDSHVTVTAAALQAIAASGRSALVTFEFYPRVAANTVHYTLTVGASATAKAVNPLPAASDRRQRDEGRDEKGCCTIS